MHPTPGPCTPPCTRHPPLQSYQTKLRSHYYCELSSFPAGDGNQGDLPASSIYSAGPHQQLFSLSLQNVNRQDPNAAATDFARVEALPGVYVANQMQPR